jgi:catechol 2,3-dioxygenase-like lactoylglutathione lyase family enzyme
MMHTIDFAGINRAAVRQLYSLLPRWLPDGKRQGTEFVALNPRRADNRPGSFSVNMKTGEWGDFAIDVKGGDPISLFAYLKGMKQGEAAKELAAQIGIQEYRNGKANGKANGHAAHHAQPAPEKSKRFYDGHLIKRGFRLVKEYDYADDGEMIYQTLRYEHPTEKKTFLARRPDGNDGWLSGAGDRRILYRGDDLKSAIPDAVFVCEGEKDADRLAGLGFVAVTVAFGEWDKGCIEALKGKEALVLEDNDGPGRDKAKKTAAHLYGIAGAVRPHCAIAGPCRKGRYL